MAQTEVRKFIQETQRQIDEEGLVAISGTDFSRGDPIRHVLMAKQIESRLYSGGLVDMINPNGSPNHKIRKGKFASVALIAQSLNQMNEAIKNGDFEPYIDETESYMDEEPKSCGPNCECYPTEESIAQAKESRKVIKRVFAEGDRRRNADAKMKIYFHEESVAEQTRTAEEIEQILQLERDGKTIPYYDY